MESQNVNDGISEPEETNLKDILIRNKQLNEKKLTEDAKIKAMRNRAEALLAKHQKIKQEKSPLDLFNELFD